MQYSSGRLAGAGASGRLRCLRFSSQELAPGLQMDVTALSALQLDTFGGKELVSLPLV